METLTSIPFPIPSIKAGMGTEMEWVDGRLPAGALRRCCTGRTGPMVTNATNSIAVTAARDHIRVNDVATSRGWPDIGAVLRGRTK